MPVSNSGRDYGDAARSRYVLLLADPDAVSRQTRLDALDQAGIRTTAVATAAGMRQALLYHRPLVALICDSLPDLPEPAATSVLAAQPMLTGCITLWIASHGKQPGPADADAWIGASSTVGELVAYAQVLVRLQQAERRGAEPEKGTAEPSPGAGPGSQGRALEGVRVTRPAPIEFTALPAHQLQQLLDNAPEALLIVQQHTIVYANRALLELLRAREATAVVGHPYLELFPVERRSRARKHIGQPITARRFMRWHEDCVLRMDGTAVPVEFAVSPWESERTGALIFVRDLTRRKQWENASRRRESELKLLVDSTPALISYVDADCCYRIVNKSYERHFGIAPEQIRGRHVRDVLGEAAWSAVEPFIRRALDGECTTYEQEVPYREGGPRWVAATYIPDRDADGTVRGFVAQVVDISKRKATEAELIESEQRFRQIAQTLSHVFWITEQSPERVLYVSPAFSELWGRAPEDLYANPRLWVDAIHPDDRAPVVESFETWLSAPGDREYCAEFRVIRPDGTIRWVCDRGNALINAAGEVARVAGIAEDITTRKQAEDALQERTERYHLVVSGAHDAIWDWDVTQRRVFYSSQWALLRGFKPEEIGDGEEEWFSRIHPEDRPQVEAALEAHFAGETAVFATEYRSTCADGSWRWLAARGIAQRDRSGRVVRVAGSENDMTDRKRLESILREGEAFKQRVLDALPAHIAVLDEGGAIIAVNETWRQFGCDNGAATPSGDDVGRSYLDVCRSAAAAGDEFAQQAFAGLSKVLTGKQDSFALEYPCDAPDKPRWFLMLIRAFPASGRGAIITHLDLTAQKCVEHALRESQRDLNQAQAIGRIGSWRVDIWRNQLVWSEENHRLFGVPKGTPLDYDRFLNTVHPEDRDFVHRSWAASLTGAPFDIEHRIIVNGEVRWVRERAELEFGSDGTLRGAFGVTQDITDRKESERRIACLNVDLQRRVNELQTVFETAPIGLAIAEDPGGQHIHANLTHARLLGLTEGGRLPIPATVPPQFRVLHAGRPLGPQELPMQRAVRGESVRDLVIDVVRPDGQTVTLHSNCEPLYDEEHRPRGAIGTFLDITEQRRAEAALRASEKRFRAMVQAVPSLTFEADAQGANTFASESWCAFTGMTATDTLGAGWAQALHPEDSAIVAERWREAMTNGTLFESRHRLRGANGLFRWFISRALPVRGATGRIERWAGSLTDIDELVQTDAALRASEIRTRQLLEALPQLVWTCRPDGTCDYLSPEWERYTGVCPRRQLGTGWLRHVHAEDRRPVVTLWRSATHTGEPFETELRIRREDGEYHWFQSRAVPLRDPSGRVVGWLGTHSDIEELKRAAGKLSEADRRKNEFLAMLSHELRNPLAPILNAAEILKACDPVDPTVQSAAAIITRQILHVKQLVDDLMDVSRITRGQVPIKRDRISIATVMEHAAEAIKPLMAKREHHFSLHLPDDSVEVLGDLVRLVQVLTNLLRNACDYSPDGATIALTARVEGTQVVIRVQDTGVGMPAELLPTIFDIFTQGPRALARSPGGLGIGLSVAKQLVEQHGGEIMAQSDGLGCGSAFTVRLPCHSTSGSGSDTHRPCKHKTTSARRILIVDDNRDAADTLGLLLDLSGYLVRKAYEGSTAIALAREFVPEVVLLDIGLPGMDGFEVAKHLREARLGPDATFVAVTGYAEPALLHQSQRAGFRHHLVKPVDIDELLQVLQALPASPPSQDPTSSPVANTARPDGSLS